MAHQVIWSVIVVEEFVRLGNLSKLDEEILRTRVAGWSITKQAETFHISTATVSRIIKRLKKRYDAVQPYSPILPPRKFSVKELYMDTH